MIDIKDLIDRSQKAPEERMNVSVTVSPAIYGRFEKALEKAKVSRSKLLRAFISDFIKSQGE